MADQSPPFPPTIYAQYKEYVRPHLDLLRQSLYLPGVEFSVSAKYDENEQTTPLDKPIKHLFESCQGNYATLKALDCLDDATEHDALNDEIFDANDSMSR